MTPHDAAYVCGSWEVVGRHRDGGATGLIREEKGTESRAQRVGIAISPGQFIREDHQHFKHVCRIFVRGTCWEWV